MPVCDSKVCFVILHITVSDQRFRCLRGRVTVGGRIVGQIDGRGLVVLCGIDKRDTQTELRTAVEKMLNMHLFEDENDAEAGRWSKSVLDRGFQVLLVSQVVIWWNIAGFSYSCSKSSL